jgi:DnaK suppressor protein
MPHNPQTIRRFEQNLRHQQKLLEKSMTSAVAQGREAATDDTRDVADQAVQSYQKELLFRQSSSGHEQLSLVRLALERLQDGTYGECIHCGNTIGAKRLEAVPWASSCIECQEKIERGELEDPVRAA